MRPTTLLRLALAGGRTDTVRVVLTGLSAALATLTILAAVTMVAVPTRYDGGANVSTQYRNPLIAEPGLRAGVVIALLLLTVPILALAGQCARLGAPARDRRLAAIRMAGAEPRQAVAIAATEGALASGLGSLLGLALYLTGRHLLHRPDPDGRLALPTDVLPPVWALAAVVLGIPVLAGLVAAMLLRRGAMAPYGVVRRVRTRPPKPWPGLLIGVGIATAMLVLPLRRYLARRGESLPDEVLVLVLLLAELAATVGVIAGTAWISYVTGRVLHRYARRPAGLLAARRLMADPWTGSRTFAALLAAVLFGAVAAGVRSTMVTDFAVRRRMAEASGDPYFPQDTDFYFRTFDLVYLALVVALGIAAAGLLIALAESIVSRRRALAALVATGVPRPVLARALVWQTVTPAVFGIGLAVATGTLLQRGTYGGEIRTAGAEVCPPPPAECVSPEPVGYPVPVPVADLAGFAGGALAAVVLLLLVSFLFLRSSTAMEELRTG